MSTENSKYLNSQDSTWLAIFTSSQILIGVTANLCVVVYFLLSRHGKQRTPSDKLTLNLAISDLIALTTYLPWRTHLLVLQERTEHSRIYTSLYVVCIFATGNGIICIAFDRFTAVVWPLRYKILITSHVSSVFIAISWMSAILFGILHGFSYKIDKHVQYELFLCATSFAQLVVLSVIYGVLLRIARKQTENISNLQREFRPGFSYLRKSVFTSFTIMCLFYVTFLPYCFYRVYSTLDKSLTDHDKHTAWRWLTAFTFINSCCNPFVYFFGIKRHRTKFAKCLQANFERYCNKKQICSSKPVENCNDIEVEV
jgi:hypothetical protein